MRVLIQVPARAGSRGFPDKNLRTISGISLVGRAIRLGLTLLRTRGLDGRVVVDTDGPNIAEEARRWGAEVSPLATPELPIRGTGIAETVLATSERFAAQGQHFDVAVVLEPTSPLLAIDDAVACFNAHAATGSALSVTESGARVPNGGVYVCRLDFLLKRRQLFVPGFSQEVVIPPERSIHIETEFDLKVAQGLMHLEPTMSVQVGARRIGPGAPCFVIAEAGVNHNGDVDVAHRLVDVAADAGADAVKFQTFDPKKLVSSRAPLAAYQAQNTGQLGGQAEMLARLVLPRAAHRELQRHAAERGLMFLSAPFDETSADFLEELGVPAFKVPSGELTNRPFVAHLARKGRPLLVSTGMADLVEVAQALDAVAEHGAPQVALFHCVTSYPAPPADTNLRAIDTLRAAFGIPAGLSDHSEGIAIALAAVGRGAHLLEKHFTLDRTMEGPDHKASLEPGELRDMVQGIRAVEAALGDGLKVPRPIELPLITAARKSLHSVQALPAGHVLARGDLIALRPGSGISPTRLEAIVGRRLSSALRAGEPLTEEHLRES